MNPFLTSLIPSLIVAVVTALLTVRLSLRRFYSERWWERKADTYTDIIEALHAKLEFLDTYFSTMLYSEQLSEEDISRMRSANKEADQKISKLVRIGTFMISQEVEAIFENYMIKQADILHDFRDNEFERFRREQKLVSYCLQNVRDAAMRDLKVAPWATPGQVLEMLRLTLRQRPDR